MSAEGEGKAAIRRARTPRPDRQVAEEVLTVTKTLVGGEERDTKTKLSVKPFLSEPAYVRVSQGMTKNMGNYESLRVDVAITLPCYPEEVEEVLPKLGDKVAAYLERELKEYGYGVTE
jgi:hypothetical protein